MTASRPSKKARPDPPPPLRITHVITRLILGGAQENTIASVLGLRAWPEFQLRLVSGPSPGAEGTLESTVAEFPGLWTLVPELVRPVHPWKDMRAWRKLTTLFRQERPHVVHTHSGKAGILGRLAARRAGVPRIVHTIHGPSFGAFQGAPANLLFTAAERQAARVTDHFVVVAHAMARQYQQAGIGRSEQFSCIRSGFDVEPFRQARPDPAVRARFGLRAGDVVIGKIARLVPLKGHDELLEAIPRVIARCPQARFLLVGDGPARARLEQAVRAAGVSGHVTFAGLVPPAEMPSLVGVMDLLVHLSRREGLARALPQALAAGRPVVAWNCDGAGEVCRDGETGFLLSVGDAPGLVESIVRLAQDPALRQQLGERGRALVCEHFTVQRMVDQLAALYRRLARLPGEATPA